MLSLPHILSIDGATLGALIPFGYVGMQRWGAWLFKKFCGIPYKPVPAGYESTVTVVTPVYNEDPEVFRQALESWSKEKTTEVIAVIDHSDQTNIKVFTEYSKDHPECVMIVTKKPGKRPALVDGVMAAKSEIVALVDSDSIWTDGTRINGIAPFVDPKIAGVTVRQNVLKTDSLARVIFDIQLDSRYSDDLPFVAKHGYAMPCLSGRTAFYRREVILPMLDDLLNEFFMGEQVISGDDKRLTTLVQHAGWKTTYQSTSQIFTPGAKDWKTYCKQRIRWGRNSWRSDISALKEGWVYKHWALTLLYLDRFIQPFSLLLGFMFFARNVVLGLFTSALGIFIWWHFSRAIRIYPHLRRKPGNIRYLTHYIVLNPYLAYLRLYALMSLNTQGWITRWDPQRFGKIGALKQQFGYIATIATLATLFLITLTPPFYNNSSSAFNKEKLTVGSIVKTSDSNSNQSSPTIPELKVGEDVIKRYVVERGDTMYRISQKFNVSPEELVKANFPILHNWNNIETGLVLSVPLTDLTYDPKKIFNYNIKRFPQYQTVYDEQTNTILISGRGRIVTLEQIAELDKYTHIKKGENGVWDVMSTLKLENGVTLLIQKPEAAWVRLASSAEKQANIVGTNSVINISGVKITSWDFDKNDYDYNHEDRRSYILSKGIGRMDVFDSELAYLGYLGSSTGGTYGVSWRIPSKTYGYSLMTGIVKNSKFHDNYFGAYTFGATAMVWDSNEFYNNVKYGLDPHDDSSYFLVVSNKFYGNGTHGLIFSKRCLNNLIKDNESYNNKLHGIMLHEKSNGNVVLNNKTYKNKDGIAIWFSGQNWVGGNLVSENMRGVRLNREANGNYIMGNTIKSSTQYGVFIYDKADGNLVSGNSITNNAISYYVNSSNNTFLDDVVTEGNSPKGSFYLLAEANSNLIKSTWPNMKLKLVNKTPKGSINSISDNLVDY